jgi:hypothetical protein
MVNNMLMLNISPGLSVKTHNTAVKIGFVNNKKKINLRINKLIQHEITKI